jgi:type IV pilus assembly protein PilB
MNPGGEGKRIGEILLEAGLVSQPQLDEALERQAKEGGRICSHLVRLGYLRSEVLLEFLRMQFGVAAVDLSKYRIAESVISRLPAATARKYRVVPLAVLGNSLTVAMVDPRDAEALEVVAAETGMAVDPLICPQAVVDEALARYYPSGLSSHDRRLLELDEKAEHRILFEPLERLQGSLGATEWLKRVIFKGIKLRSREIHLEPRDDHSMVRYRLGAQLVNGDPVPREAAASMLERLIQMGLQRPEARAGSSREGWIRFRIRHRELKLLFAIFPVLYGDRAVLKLMDESALKRPLSEEGMDREDETRLTVALRSRRGILLVVSPSPAARQWTFYHLLDLVKNDRLNVITVEPVIHMPLSGINQTECSAEKGERPNEMLLRSLQQEPDVLGVAEMQDDEVLETSLAAATQCLVVGTAVMGDVLQALQWIMGLGYNHLALAHLVVGVLGLSVVPRLCPACRRPLEGRIQILEGTRESRPEDLRFFEAPGCDRCEGSGRAGQVGLFECLLLDDGLRELMAQGSPPKVVYEEAQRLGMRTITEDGILKASRGEVDVRDVMRSAPTGLDPRA